ncbi:glycosyltransferase family 2 protein [Paraburkholderia metrosideri]|jgi:glycosyltransferase involved in cell wall biosynthesis|uniref:Glycosyltransferase YkoT n=1 Tax=Paraburkholderia metrosideri TaxID=580937 RepID=A0ABM8NWE0_9BURK|nr:glycosyltransferase family 2 protein [Paraburkholderia metrosideri]CAD6546662.1 putative glycosyltransferase YkoT [Paraburkholderia metrosideri]
MSEYVESLTLDKDLFRNGELLATTLNLVVPCYNEEEVLPETSTRLFALLDRLIKAGEVSDESRIVFVDDGSRDHTWSIIEALHATNARYGGIKLSRNRGHQNALLAGLLTVQGDVIVSLDADLQDDVEAIPRMLAQYRLGAEIVFGVRHKRDTDTFFKRFTARNYYKLLGTFGVDIQPGHADFRLMSRKTVEALRQFQEVNLFLRGIIPLLGFKTAVVEYERAPRFAGESKYPLGKMLAFAFDGITSFSAVPLQWSTRIGALLAFGSLCFGAWAAFARLFTDLTVPGWASTVIPMYFLGGIQLLFLGVIGGYISKTYAETKQRPRFIIERTL